MYIDKKYIYIYLHPLLCIFEIGAIAQSILSSQYSLIDILYSFVLKRGLFLNMCLKELTVYKSYRLL